MPEDTLNLPLPLHLSMVLNVPPDRSDPASADPAPRKLWAALAGHIDGAGMGDRAALARLDPDALRPQAIGALSRVLLKAGLSPEHWQPQAWPRWALIAHGMALAGHDGQRPLGEQLDRARVSESRVHRLLIARGDAFRQLLPGLLRLLASQGVAPNWHELGELVLLEARTDQPARARAESLRLDIARHYHAHQARRMTGR
ncbi:MAG: hypothetical protein RLZZ524_1492 [Pseudomonadota bacterium]|jgi:CRISPR system Cascade subunit CasB